MRQSSYFILCVYYIGFIHGLFRFSYNSTTEQFEVTKKSRYFNDFMAFFTVSLSVILFLIQDDSLAFRNLVIQVTGPMNFFSVSAILINIYMLLWLRNEDIVKMLNFALKLDKHSQQKKFEFKSKFFLKTFAVDFASIILNTFILIRSKEVFRELPFKFVVIFNIMQFFKVIGRYGNNLFIFSLSFLEHLLENLEMKMEKSLKDYEIFGRLHPRSSMHQITFHCCTFNKELEHHALQYENIVKLAIFVKSLFTRHILFETVQILTDVLLLVC